MINKLIEWIEGNRLVINKAKTIAISLHQPQKVHFECPSIKIYDTGTKYSEQLKFFAADDDDILG
jgi:DNA gyrase inhibitor GyrI